MRRAWLCGIDSYTGKSFEHRKPIVEARIHQLGEIFAVGIHTYAVINDRVHVVLSVTARSAYDWSNEQVALRWVVLYPPKATDFAVRLAEICCPGQSEKRVDILSRASGDRFNCLPIAFNSDSAKL